MKKQDWLRQNSFKKYAELHYWIVFKAYVFSEPITCSVGSFPYNRKEQIEMRQTYLNVKPSRHV